MDTPQDYERAVMRRRVAEKQAIDLEAAKMMQARQEQAKDELEVQARQELQRQRNLRHEGTAPAEVWGEQAGRSCAAFIGYILSISDSPSQPRGAELLEVNRPYERRFLPPKPHKEPYWGMHGFRVAYSNTWQLQNTPNAFVFERGSTPPLPEPDIYLCFDGLLRRGADALTITDSRGSITPPTPGGVEWVYKDQESVLVHTNMSTPAADSRWETRKRYELQFMPLPIEIVLETIANEVG